MIKIVPENEIAEIRKRRSGNHKLVSFLDEFMRSDIKIATIEYRDLDYASVISCYNNMYRCSRHNRFPIKVVLRGEKVYLVKL